MDPPPALPRFVGMNEDNPAWRVRVGVVGRPPVDRIERAAGVSEVDVHGQVVRCRIDGSFQPFLEALLGCEVLTLQSAPLAPLSEGGQ
jgi:hypothetical protein